MWFVFDSEDELPLYDGVEEKVSQVLYLCLWHQKCD